MTRRPAAGHASSSRTRRGSAIIGRSAPLTALQQTATAVLYVPDRCSQLLRLFRRLRCPPAPVIMQNHRGGGVRSRSCLIRINSADVASVATAAAAKNRIVKQRLRAGKSATTPPCYDANPLTTIWTGDFRRSSF